MEEPGENEQAEQQKDKREPGTAGMVAAIKAAEQQEIFAPGQCIQHGTRGTTQADWTHGQNLQTETTGQKGRGVRPCRRKMALRKSQGARGGVQQTRLLENVVCWENGCEKGGFGLMLR